MWALCQNETKLCLWLQTYYSHSKFNLNGIIIVIFFISPVDIFLHLIYGTQKFKIRVKSFCCWLLKENKCIGATKYDSI